MREETCLPRNQRSCNMNQQPAMELVESGIFGKHYPVKGGLWYTNRKETEVQQMKSNSSFMKAIFNGDIEEKTLLSYPFFNTSRESDFQMMAESIQSWLKENVNSEKFEDDRCLPKDFVQGLKEMGLFGLIIPEIYGGSEFTQTFYARTLELITTHDSSVVLTVGAHQSIGLKGLYLFGTPEQKQKYMPKLATGEIIAAFALTEPTAGSDAAGIRSKLVKDGDHYILNGSKLWITNGGLADFFTVFAKEKVGDEEKITAIMVTRDMGGVSHGPEEQKLGIKASSTVEVNFKDTRVPASNVLGNPGDGFKIAMAILNQGRLGLASGALGTIKSLVQQCATYTKGRKAFNHSISDFGLVKKMITDLTANAYAVESMTYLTTHFVDLGDVDYSIEAAICKVYATEVAWESLNIAMQAHGGNGYMKDYGIERKLRDGRIGLIFEGTNEILRLFIALTGLKEPASEYKKNGKELVELQKINSLDQLNTAISKIGVISEFAFNQAKQMVVKDKVSGFHKCLEKEVERLQTATQALATNAGKLIRQSGQKLVDEQLQLGRVADIAIQTYLIAAVLSRINSRVSATGVEKNAQELSLARYVIRNAKAKINQLSFDIKQNRDAETIAIADYILGTERYPFNLN